MRRTLCLLTVALLVAPSLGSDAPKDDATARTDELEGTWRLVAYRADPGQPFTQFERFGEITYRGGRWSSHFGFAARAGTYTTDPGRRHLDATTESGRARRHLYRVGIDRLWVATVGGGQVRPESFDQEGVTVSEYERVKK